MPTSGPPAVETYAESVAREVAGVRSLTAAPNPLYAVQVGARGCFELVRRRPDPRAPFGQRASFCFDRRTGAVLTSTVRHEGGVVEHRTVREVEARVTDADLTP